MRLGLGLGINGGRRVDTTSPVNLVLPAISGTAEVGETLSASTGTWDHANTYAYQWKRAGVAIDGATASTYDPVAADIGAVLTVTVTATDPGGSASATSAGTAAVVSAPINTVAASVDGDGSAYPLYETHVLTANVGTWLGVPTSYAYQWKRGGVDISSATDSTYELVSADVGASISVRVTATNAQGSASSTSSGTAAITAVASPTVPQDGGDQTSPGVTSDTVTMPGSVVSGAAIFVSFAIYQGSGARSVTSITDNKGNTYSRVDAVESSAAGARAEIWAAYNVTGGASFQITVNYSAGTFAAWGAIEVDNVNANAVLIVEENTGTSDPATFTTDAIKGAARQLLIGILSMQGGGANAGIVTPTNYSEFHVFQAFATVMAGQGIHRVINSKAAQSISWDHNASPSPWAGIFIAVRRGEAAQYPTVRASHVSAEVLSAGATKLRCTNVAIEVLAPSA